ncbi:iron-sulfur cluster assembly protein [Pseudomonas akapageensis]|uniref:iron-sulfur cluster assembly protein n=1 Tax=Pseudomonas akapageensis TaxID=2609961 RepID=UPI00140AEB9A|nr:iron-sulfur cluster assembly protein [Pseudomonas akapageensis]
MTTYPLIPGIHLSDSARQILHAALADESGLSVRLRIDEHFAHELLFEPDAEGDIVVNSDGIRLLLDPASAGRADGLSIDFVQELRGAGFTFDNPNRLRQNVDVRQVLDILRNVYDPELPVNVVDLGLIYDCQTHGLDSGGQRVEIKMSMTAPGCGMSDMLKEAVRTKVQSLPGVSQVFVEIVWEPPWDQSRMSDAARLQLGML